MAERYSTDEVQALADEFIRFKRYVEDALENLDVNNFADGAWKKMVTKFGDVFSAGFEAYADAEKAIARMFAEYKKDISSSLASIEAIADANGASITQLVTWQGNVDTSINDLQIRDSTLAESISKIEQTANGNGATIASLVEWKGDAQKSAASIEQAADANGAFIKMLVSAGSNKDPDEVIAPDIAGIYITAMNNNSTEIKLSAKVIQLGDNANVDANGNFYAKKLWGDSTGDAYIDGKYYPGFFYTEIGSGSFVNDMLVGANLFVKDYNENIMYGFEHKVTEGEDADSVNFIAGGKPTWGYNYVHRKLYPKGVWDFSACSVEGLGLVPVFG